MGQKGKKYPAHQIARKKKFLMTRKTVSIKHGLGCGPPTADWVYIKRGLRTMYRKTA